MFHEIYRMYDYCNRMAAYYAIHGRTETDYVLHRQFVWLSRYYEKLLEDMS